MLLRMSARGYFLLLALAAAASGAQAGPWTDDFEEASKLAKAENRFMLLDFTGSDWCGWCKLLEAEVFSRSEFKAYARDNLVCVTVDFPRGFSLKKRVAEQNAKLAGQLGVTGYPTIHLLDPDGNRVARTGYKEGGAKAYVAHLEELLGPTRQKIGPVKAAAPGTLPVPGGATAATTPAYRTWTSSSGQTIEARVEQRVGTKVYLRTRENKLITIDSASLSAGDQDFLRGGR